MTNLEWLSKKGLITVNTLYSQGEISGVNIVIALRDEDYLSFSNKKDIDWLLEEHKEAIKLKQWEYDLINTNNMSHERAFDSFATYENMRKIGHFQGVTNTSMSLHDILNNCEIIE